MRLHHLALLICLCNSQAFTSSAQECSQVLPLAFKTYSKYGSNDVTTSVYNFLLSDDFRSFMQKQSNGFGIGFDGFSFDNKSSSEQYQNFRNYLNTNNSSAFRQKIVENVLSQAPDSTALQVWLQCVELTSLGLHLNHVPQGNSYKLIFRYIPTPGITRMTLETLIITNADYDQTLLSKGFALQASPTSLLLTPKNRQQDINISIKATGNITGSTIVESYQIPGVPLVRVDSSAKQTVSNRDNCLEGHDSIACVLASVEVQEKYGQKAFLITDKDPISRNDQADIQLAVARMTNFFKYYYMAMRNGSSYATDRSVLERDERLLQSLLIKHHIDK